MKILGYYVDTSSQTVNVQFGSKTIVVDQETTSSLVRLGVVDLLSVRRRGVLMRVWRNNLEVFRLQLNDPVFDSDDKFAWDILRQIHGLIRSEREFAVFVSSANPARRLE